MAQRQDTGRPALLEPDRPQTEATPQAAPSRHRGRFLPLVALIAGTLVVLGVWTVTQSRMTDELVDTPRIYSDHDAGIEQLLRERAEARKAVGGTGPGLQHLADVQGDSGIGEGEEYPEAHDSWLPKQESGGGTPVVPPQHDSVIDTRLKDRAEQCPPPPAGAGGGKTQLC